MKSIALEVFIYNHNVISLIKCNNILKINLGTKIEGRIPFENLKESAFKEFIKFQGVSHIDHPMLGRMQA